MNKKTITAILVILLLVAILGCLIYFLIRENSSSNQTQNTISNSNNFQKGQRGNGNMGRDSVDKSTDTELQNLIDEVVDKYEVKTFEGMEYNIFVPENYDKNTKYPLILFIPDSSLVGKSAKEQLTQGYGGIIWASAEEQAKHPCFVVVPVITTTLTNDNWQVSDQINTVVDLVKEIQNTYNIDTNRTYTTGQSMGCMASFYMNITHNDLFAASLYVSGQWDTEALGEIEDDKFFYIVSAGDEKASNGLKSLKSKFDKDNVDYTYGEEWDATWSDEEFTPVIEQLTNQNKNINMGVLKQGTTLTNGATGGMAGEHMTSFDYIYKIDAVRDWLFEQSK